MKKTISVLLLLALCLSLCASGSQSSNAKGAAPAEAPMPYPNTAYVTTDAAYEYAEEPMWESDEESYGFSPAEAVMAGRGESDVPAEKPDKIIYSANVQVETTDFDGSMAKLDELIDQYGGWVESSSVNGSNYADRSRGNVSRRSASYVLRFPSDRFDELMGSLSVLGNVPYTHVYTENVTAQYYDVQARLTAYTAQEQRLLEMMELAETVEDIIILEDRLTEVRYQIERLQSSLNNWDRQVSYSTVYLDLTEVQEYTPEPQVQPSFGQRLLGALQDGLRAVGSFFEGLLFGLTEALPALLLIAALALIPILLIRKARKKRKARRAAFTAPAEQPAAETRPPEEGEGE